MGYPADAARGVDASMHGSGGVQGILQQHEANSNPYTRYYVEACKATGDPELAHNSDYNGPSQFGSAYGQAFIGRDGIRSDTYSAWIRNIGALKRQNLTVAFYAFVSSVVVEGGVTKGVNVRFGKNKAALKTAPDIEMW
jgi:choline dehydrogenase-like flavoprotein